MGHMCATPLPCHRWLADCGARSGCKKVVYPHAHTSI
ncbi:unnamed protein product [Spirodela intermedia]|uniref:Uncharacterized protein n=1 Tax=Spirodela intermedia TaxID=51605 RepID=A0A7I8KSJ9_SPIIN|nr:unnamed protein product [Spirodela intermedia]